MKDYYRKGRKGGEHDLNDDSNERGTPGVGSKKVRKKESSKTLNEGPSAGRLGRK